VTCDPSKVWCGEPRLRDDSLNLILTKACNKRCSFCFTDSYSKETEMSLEFIERVLDHFPLRTVKLLGGEPTEHSKFREIVALLDSRRQDFSLISNMLFDERMMDFLRLHSDMHILANAMELDKGKRVEVWRRNVEAIPTGSMAFTISEGDTIEKWETYLKFLKSNMRGLPRGVRVGLDLSGDWLLCNTVVGDIVKTIRSHFPHPRHDLYLDCQFPRCIWSFDPQELHMLDGRFVCPNPALDVFHDGSIIYCYPASHFRLDDIFSYATVNDMAKDLRLQYQAAQRQHELPDVCKQCHHLLWWYCKGLCEGCHASK